MRIVIPRESAAGERRTSATPETVKKMIRLGAAVAVESGAGAAVGFDAGVDSELGAGAFGVVRSGVHLTTGEACAVKCLTVDSRVLDEVAVHGELHHANVVVLLGHVLKKAQVFVAMELCGGGDLYGSIRARAERPFSYLETRT